MKKLWILLSSVFVTTSAFALPVGNPWEASLMTDGIFWEGNGCNPCPNLCEAWSFRVGFYGDYVFNNHMQVNTKGNSSSIHQTELYTNAGYLAFNLWDRVDLFAALGVSSLHIHTISTRPPAPEANLHPRTFIDTDSQFSWSVGLRGTLWECGCFGLGGEFQYFQTSPDINSIRIEGQGTSYPSGQTLDYHEWQGGLGIAYRVNIACCSTALIPYLGVKGSYAWSDADDLNYRIGEVSGTLFDLKSERYFGYAVGMTLLGCNKGSVTVEGRFLNEKAVYVNGQVRF